MAAIPVGAVTKVVERGNFEIMYLNKVDFPVPAQPLKKTFFPAKTCSTTFNCSFCKIILIE